MSEKVRGKRDIQITSLLFPIIPLKPAAIQNSSCSCPSDLWKCDPEHGCVCPLGQDCGIEERSGQEVVIDYIKMEEDKAGVSTRAGVIAAIVISLVVAGTLVACLITFYYR